jgi:hypothetical protein
LAEVPYRASPSNEPAATPPTVYYEPRIDREAIGAVGRGLQQFGAGVKEAGDFWAEVQTDHNLNNALEQGDKAVENFKTLRGADATEAEPGVRQNLSDIGDRYRSTLSPAQQLQFDKIWRNYKDRYWNGQITTHSDQQGLAIATETNKAGADIAFSQAAANPYDEDLLAEGLRRSREATVKQGYVQGIHANTPAMQALVAANDSNYYARVAEARFASGDSVGAQKYLEDHKTALSYGKETGNTNYDVLSARFSAKVEAERNGLLTQSIKDQADKGGDFSNVPDGLVRPAPQTPAPSAAPSNVVPFQQKGAAPVPQAPAAPGATDALGRTGGQGVTIDVPFADAVKYGSPDNMINQALKTYKPGTTIRAFGNSYTIPPAGTKFPFGGKEYTVPSEPTAPAATPQAQKMSFTPESVPSPPSSLGPSFNLGPSYQGKLDVAPEPGGINRSAFMAEIDQKPWLIPKMASMVYGEVGKGAPVKTKLVQLETAFNRAQARGHSLEQALLSVGESGKGYYDRNTYHRVSQEDVDSFVNDVLKPVLAGSDAGQGVTGNASGGVAARQTAKGYYLPAAGGAYESYFYEDPHAAPLPRNPGQQAAAASPAQIATAEE